MQLNEAAAYIWKMLFNGEMINEMAAQIAMDFEISVDEAYEALNSFLRELVEQNYLIIEMEDKSNET